MSKKLERTATIALGVGVISKGAEMVGAGNYKAGIVAIAAGVAVVHGYHTIEDIEIMEMLTGEKGDGE